MNAATLRAPVPTAVPAEHTIVPVHRWQWVVLGAATAIAWLIFSAALLTLHSAYNSNAFDLGFFDQIIWNTSEGRWFETSFVEYNFLGQHMAPVLLLFAAAYRLGAGIEAVLVVQAGLATGAAVPLFLAARVLLRSATAALLIAVAYLLSPHLHGAVLFDFHPEVMGIPAIFGAFALLVYGHPGWSLAAVASLALLKEDAALAAAGFSLIVWLAGYRRHAGALLAASLLYLGLVAGFLMPAIRGGPGDLQERYGYLGRDAPSVAVAVLRDPGRVAGRLIARPQREAAVYLAASLTLLPLASVAALAAVPPLAAHLLSTHPPQGELTLHYAALPYALLVVAAVLGARRVSRVVGVAFGPPESPMESDDGTGVVHRAPTVASRVGARFIAPAARGCSRLIPHTPARNRSTIAIAALILAATCAAWFLGSPLGPRRFDVNRYRPTPHHTAVGRILAHIPADAAVSAQSGLLPHLSRRREVWEFPRLESAAYVVVDRQGWRSSQADGAGFDQALTSLPALGFCRIAGEDGVELYVRGAPCASP